MSRAQPQFAFHTAWSQSLNSSPRGLRLVRERDWVLAWDQHDWLYLFDHAGQPQGQVHFSGNLVTACCADDGSAYAAVGTRGEVCWLAPDLMTRWQQTLPNPAVAVAMDPFGQYLAVSDIRGHVHFFDRLGQSGASLQTPRALHHLAFVPAAPVLVGCADYGLVTAFEMTGVIRWRDGLVAHAGALTVSGDGARIVIACFSEGLHVYDLEGRKQPRVSAAEPCRLASIAFNGRLILAAGMSKRLFILNSEGDTLGTQALDVPIASAELGALGDYGVAALVDGPVVRLDLRTHAKTS